MWKSALRHRQHSAPPHKLCRRASSATCRWPRPMSDYRRMVNAPLDGTWVILLGTVHGEPAATAAFWSADPDPGWYAGEAHSRPVFLKPQGWLPCPPELIDPELTP